MAFQAGMSGILPNLFLGGMQDALGPFEGWRLYVHEQPPLYTGDNCLWIPILPGGPTNKASRTALDLCATVIDSILVRGAPILVHCAQGIERGPLTVAWFLHTRRGMTIDQAYDWVIAHRPQVERRDLAWL